MKQVELVKLSNKPLQMANGLFYGFLDNEPTCHRICWLDQDVTPGQIISLKGDDTIWAVKQVWDVEKEKVEINRTWHVGGL